MHNRTAMGYTLILIGVVCTIVGIVIIKKANTAHLPDFDSIREVPSSPTNSSKSKDEIFEENKKKGDDFEAFVVKSFPKKYYQLQEWRGDKYVDGNYPVSSHFPDLEVNFKLNDHKDTFAIECKWRSRFYKDGIKWAEGYQIENYKKYSVATKLPVYVVIGVDGTPSKPKHMYVIPLSKLSNSFISKDELNPYEKDVKADFYWSYKEKKLLP
tara:strand:+ start:59023 stop:59658 length:636 start_codon:yes stop_codon:yes gene_type:complete